MNTTTQNKRTALTLDQGRKPGSGRIFNASKYSLTRAWEISKNAAVAHNTNPVLVAQQGLVKASEYFKDALVIAWIEARDKQAKNEIEAYKLYKVPKKSLAKILNAIASFIVVNKLAKTTEKDTVLDIIRKGADASKQCKESLSTAIFDARFTTVAARSTNRHTLKALPEIAETGFVPVYLEDKTYL